MYLGIAVYVCVCVCVALLASMWFREKEKGGEEEEERYSVLLVFLLRRLSSLLATTNVFAVGDGANKIRFLFKMISSFFPILSSLLFFGYLHPTSTGENGSFEKWESRNFKVSRKRR